ncbi:MAG: alkaline phosphatase family protein, partial [Acidimicrobiales bacterium]
MTARTASFDNLDSSDDPGNEGTGQRILSRRNFLGAALAGGATFALASCGGGTSGSAAPSSAGVVTTGLRRPGSLVRPDLAPGTDTIPQIGHIIVVMMENHSFDNFFGMLGRGDGFALDAHGVPNASNPAPDGSTVHAFHMPTPCQLDGRPSQTWNDTHIQYNGGAMNGFVRSLSGPVAMGYWTGQELPFSYALARKFPVADRYFASAPAQTYPNRRYMMAGTSLGLVGDPTPTTV